ncbi:MAG: glycosyltransferase [Bacteroides sp.]|nr:glycosyltransferase [Bacteroides sp.]MCM1414247.1 glycosyltransferase [Bacteroides sp.]MCM1471218.1 glycosyltransferase [Bacteroides sp.]
MTAVSIDKSSSQPLVSVIVLTYNQQGSIRRTLDSILAQQTDFDYEIVVSDDCSKDRTSDIVAEYASRFKQLRLLEHHDRLGLVDNYFHALSHCEGKYIADCAGDDYWTVNDTLQRKVEILEGHPETTICFTDFILEKICDGGEIVREVVKSPLSDPLEINGRKAIPIVLSALGYPAINLSASLYRRSVLDEALRRNASVVRNPSFGSEDMPIICALLNQGDVRYLAECPDLVYVSGSDTISNPANLTRQAEYFMESAKMIARLADYYGVGRKAVRKVLASKLHHAMCCCFGAKEREMARRINDCCKKLRVRRSFGFWLRYLFV